MNTLLVQRLFSTAVAVLLVVAYVTATAPLFA